MAQYTYSFKKDFVRQQITSYMPSVARVVLVTEKDILEDIACMHSLAMKACDKEGHKGSETSSEAIGTGQPFIWCVWNQLSYQDAVRFPAKKRQLKPDRRSGTDGRHPLYS